MLMSFVFWGYLSVGESLCDIGWTCPVFIYGTYFIFWILLIDSIRRVFRDKKH